MSELPLHTIENQQDISLESLSVPNWMYRLWEWADENKIQKKKIPRNKDELLNLKKLELLFIFFHTEENDRNSLTQNEHDDSIEKLSNDFSEAVTIAKENRYLAAEIGYLIHLEELCISMNPIEQLPDKIIHLKDLKKLCLCHNTNLVLTENQKDWVRELEANGSEVYAFISAVIINPIILGRRVGNIFFRGTV
jgi:Leucine-rich repeat (LRR) protein